MKYTKRGVAVLLVGFMLYALTGCHSIDSALGKVSDKNNADNPAAEQSNGEKTMTEEELAALDAAAASQVTTIPPEQMFKMREPIMVADYVIVNPSTYEDKYVPDALTYTITKATIFKDLSEAGIDPSTANDVVSHELLNEEGNLKPSVKILLIDLTVKNVNTTEEQYIPEFIPAHANELTTSSGITTGIFHGIESGADPVYFSNPTNMGRDYFKYWIPKGRSKNLKVAYYVDTEKYDQSKLFLMLPLPESEEVEAGSSVKYGYVKLEF